jgi:outer membrane biogenesis lipoprotein LolB
MFSKSVLWYRERSQSQGEVLPSEKKNMIAKLWDYSNEYSLGRSQSRSKQITTFQFHVKPHTEFSLSLSLSLSHTHTHTNTNTRMYNSTLLDSDDRITIDHHPVVAFHSPSYACIKY